MAVNNVFYDSLLHDWWEAKDHMIVFLREESRIKLKYLELFVPQLSDKHILDLGAGGGFLSIPLAKRGAKVTALDYSEESLNVLKHKAEIEGIGSQIDYIVADATAVLELEKKYDLILAFDVLEHIAEPAKLIQNAANNLKKDGGIFAYYTLNQTFWCWLLYLQIVPRLIKRDPGDVHQYKYNLKPEQVTKWIEEAGLKPSDQVGVRAPFFQKATWELITKGQLETPLNFEFTPDLSLGYLGLATF